MRVDSWIMIGAAGVIAVSVGAVFCAPRLTGPEDASAADEGAASFVGGAQPSLLTKESRYLVIDQFGYRPKMKKVAILVDPQKGWNSVDSYDAGRRIEVRSVGDDRVVYAGAPTPWQDGRVEESSGDRGSWFDFSEVEEAGSYYLYDAEHDVRSFEFSIGKDVYGPILDAATRMFYFNRANFAKVAPFACVGDKCWVHGMDNLGPGQDAEARSVRARGNASTARDLSGGWWDAGDTNKYTTFTYSVMHQLLSAYEERPQAFDDDSNIPESGNGIPDIVDEMKIELDFLKKMQAEDLDGGVLVKMGSLEHDELLPEENKNPRYYYPGSCSSAVTTVAGIFAHAGRVLSRLPALEKYAADLQKRAVAAWDHFQNHPKSDSCDDGTIRAGDADISIPDQEMRAVTAAVYLFAVTGDDRFRKFVDDHMKLTRPFTEDRWSIYEAPSGDALLFYASLPNATPASRQKILERKKKQAAEVDLYGFKPERDLYRAYMRRDSYHWGSNQARANYGSTNWDLVQYDLVSGAERDEVLERVGGIVHSFHGVNPMQLVYLSNMEPYGAERSVSEIFHTWFRDGDERWDSSTGSELGPAPGFLVGGPSWQYCQNERDHGCYDTEFKNQPVQKAYVDFNTGWRPRAKFDMSWALTEPAIYYQAAYVKLLSKFVGD